MAKTKDEVKTKIDEQPKNDPGTDVATRRSTDLVTMEDFSTETAGKGMEALGRDEFRIPFLRILDPKSPQCKPAKNGGMGAKAGMFFNIATGEMYDGEEGFEFIPCFRDYNYVEWLKRNPDGSGGGFVSIHTNDDPDVLRLLADQGRFKKLQLRGADGKDHEIVQSFYLYGLLVDPYGSLSRVILAFSGMQCKKYTNFVNRYSAIKYKTGEDANGHPIMTQPCIWHHRWRITSTYEDRGEQNWFGYVIELAARDKDGKEDRDPKHSFIKKSDPLFLAGAEFYDLISGGKAKVDYNTAEQSGGAEDPDAIPM